MNQSPAFHRVPRDPLVPTEVARELPADLRRNDDRLDDGVLTEEERLVIDPSEAKYLFVYPFIKTRDWYWVGSAKSFARIALCAAKYGPETSEHTPDPVITDKRASDSPKMRCNSLSLNF